MNRGASAAVQAEWAKAQNACAHLIEMVFDTDDGGTVYLTDSYRTLSWNGNTYIGLGHFLGWTGLVESFEMRIADVQVEISGVDQTYIAVFLQRQYVDRQLVIRKFFFDASDAIIVDPVAIHDGRMDDPRIVEDVDSGKSTVQIASRDEFADFERLSGRHTNPHDQNRFFPNDRALDMLGQLSQKTFTWGHIKEPAATGLGAATQRLVHSVGKLFGADI